MEARIETYLKLRRYQAQIETWTMQLAAKVREQTREIRNRNEVLIAMLEKEQKSLDDTIVAFSNVMELRYPRMISHAINVAEISEKVAIAMGLSNAPAIRMAGLLHDIGKHGLSDTLLQKGPYHL